MVHSCSGVAVKLDFWVVMARDAVDVRVSDDGDCLFASDGPVCYLAGGACDVVGGFEDWESSAGVEGGGCGG